MIPRILFLAESLNVGGAEKALVSLLGQLDYSRFDITLKLISKSGDFVSDAEQIPGLHIKCVGTPSSRPVRNFINRLKIKCIYSWLPAKFVGNCLCHGYDVVIAFCEGYLSRWVAASTVRCRKIAWVHTDMVDNDWPLRTGVFNTHDEESRAYSEFDCVIGVTDLVSDGMKRKFGCREVFTIYNLLDPSIQQKSLAVTEPLTRRHLNISAVGRLEPVKGFDRLIEAMDILVNRYRADIQLVIVGDGSCLESLKQRVEELNLGAYVYFAGRKSNPYPYIRQADIFVCPSRQEGFNIAVLEAMALGKAIVSTDCIGPREILENGHSGRICGNNVDDLANAIHDLYNDPDEINHLSALAVRRSNAFRPESQILLINRLLQLD